MAMCTLEHLVIAAVAVIQQELGIQQSMEMCTLEHLVIYRMHDCCRVSLPTQ
jgi:hypothetical protein